MTSDDDTGCDDADCDTCEHRDECMEERAQVQAMLEGMVDAVLGDGRWFMAVYQDEEGFHTHGRANGVRTEAALYAAAINGTLRRAEAHDIPPAKVFAALMGRIMDAMGPLDPVDLAEAQTELVLGGHPVLVLPFPQDPFRGEHTSLHRSGISLDTVKELKQDILSGLMETQPAPVKVGDRIRFAPKMTRGEWRDAWTAAVKAAEGREEFTVTEVCHSMFRIDARGELGTRIWYWVPEDFIIVRQGKAADSPEVM